MAIFPFYLHAFLVNLLSLSLCMAAAPPLSPESLPPSGAAISPLNYSRTPTQSPSPAATALINTTSNTFPPIYLVSQTLPQLILQISPRSQTPIPLGDLTYLVINGLNELVAGAVLERGDSPIASPGLVFRAPGLNILVTSHLPGTGTDLTFSSVAPILRGIWEVTALYGSFTLDLEIYIGGQSPAYYRGHVNVYKSAPGNSMAGNETAEDGAGGLVDTAR
ncbi:hypothetical protein MMC28_008519 [Mycoblastus sanguinarius]|nr:hypothetical protein [Mycoblastus sanguinarius]